MSVRCTSANGISPVRTSKKTIAKLYTSAEFVYAMLSSPNISGAIHGVEPICSVVNLSCNFERPKSVTLTCKDERLGQDFCCWRCPWEHSLTSDHGASPFFCDCQIVCNRDGTFCCITCLRCHHVGLCIVVFEFEMSSK